MNKEELIKRLSGVDDLRAILICVFAIKESGNWTEAVEDLSNSGYPVRVAQDFYESNEDIIDYVSHNVYDLLEEYLMQLILPKENLWLVVWNKQDEKPLDKIMTIFNGAPPSYRVTFLDNFPANDEETMVIHKIESENIVRTADFKNAIYENYEYKSLYLDSNELTIVGSDNRIRRYLIGS